MLGHPILLEASCDKLNAYQGVEIFMWQCRGQKREKFASALRRTMPELSGQDIWTFFPERDPVVNRLILNSKPLPNTYLCIIQTSRNLINHAEVYSISQSSFVLV